MRVFVSVFLVSLLLPLAACQIPRSGNDDDDSAPAGDRDGDGVLDADDPFPDDPACWTDADGDGHCDETDDACPDDAANWTDADGDGHCDETDDACLNDIYNWTDVDGDAHCDETDDLCPDDVNNWSDADGDGHCDQTDDDCPSDAAGHEDADGDGHCVPEDDCPDDAGGWQDTNNDGVCDGTDDNDGDGITNGEELSYGEDCAISDPDMVDTDGDGIDDNEDYYPRDPYTEYILFRNDVGTIDMALSNRDGTFQAPQEIGSLYGDTGNTSYRYTGFVISDFDNNGRTDFLAIGDSLPEDSTNLLDLWWFGRVTGPNTFAQNLISDSLDLNFLWTVADVNGDEKVDLVRHVRTPASGANITDAQIYSYLNQGDFLTAQCAYTEDATNPDGCAFVRVHAMDANSWAVGQWIWGIGRDAVDVDGDGERDVVMYTISSGGNSPVPVRLMTGNGDGTFTMASHELFTHNQSSSGQSPVNTVVFADFDNDDLGDLIVGLDDDGDAGSAWFYPGAYNSTTGYTINTTGAFESFDLNPGAESGGENYGVTSSTRAFDFNFDGKEDLLVGYNSEQPWGPPSETVYMEGLGTGSFASSVVVREYSDTSWGRHFAVPRRLCRRFSISN